MNENVNKAEDMSMVQACNTGVKAAVPYGAGDEQGEAAAVSAADILNITVVYGNFITVSSVFIYRCISTFNLR